MIGEDSYQRGREFASLFQILGGSFFKIFEKIVLMFEKTEKRPGMNR